MNMNTLGEMKFEFLGLETDESLQGHPTNGNSNNRKMSENDSRHSYPL